MLTMPVTGTILKVARADKDVALGTIRESCSFVITQSWFKAYGISSAGRSIMTSSPRTTRRVYAVHETKTIFAITEINIAQKIVCVVGNLVLVRSVKFSMSGTVRTGPRFTLWFYVVHA